MINEAGSFSLYAAINRWIPKMRKNNPSNTRMTCRTHHRISDMVTGFNFPFTKPLSLSQVPLKTHPAQEVQDYHRPNKGQAFLLQWNPLPGRTHLFQ